MVLRLILSLIPTYGNLTRLAAVLVGLVLPTFESFKAIESRTLDDDKQWLTYWVCYATLISLETVTWSFLVWIPLYRITRVVLLAWLALPQFKGAAFVYEEFVRPFLLVAVDRARQVPSLEPYFAGFAPSKNAGPGLDARIGEAVRKVEGVAETAKQQAQSMIEPEDEQPSAYQPLKAHAQ